MLHVGLKWTFLQYLAVKAHPFLLISSDYWKNSFFAPSLFNQISVLFRHLEKSKSNTCSHFLKSLRVNYGSIREFWHPFHLVLLNLSLLDLIWPNEGEKRLSRTTTKTLLLITDHQFAWSTYPAAPWCVHRMRHLLLARFSLQTV